MTATLISTNLENDRCPRCGEMLKLAKRPVAFRVKARSGDWIPFTTEEFAREFADVSGGEMQGLYVRDGQ